MTSFIQQIVLCTYYVPANYARGYKDYYLVDRKIF